MRSHQSAMIQLLSISVIFVNCLKNGESKNGIFESSNFWNVDDKPVMANGHVGFVPYADAMTMNGLYNGYKGKSHRARIPNYANIQFEPCTRQTNSERCSYALDIYNGVFRTQTQLNVQFDVEHIQYAHRYYETAVVNHIRLKRSSVKNDEENEPLKLRLIQSTTFNSVDLSLKSSKIVQILDKSVVSVEAVTKILEHPSYQHNFSTVSILYEAVPEFIELKSDQIEVEYTWITIIQQNSSDIERIFQEIHENEHKLFEIHSSEWRTFWSEKQISAEGNEELSNAIDASIFALASALPSLNTSHPKSRYFGLSPSGLGLADEVYQGHSFWDTEVWMHPTILLIEPKWSEELLNYRHFMRYTAHDNAVNTSYEGYRFPWESAFTGIDVTVDEYPDIIKYQQHITSDIGHALRQHFFATQDLSWFRTIGCDLTYGTAQFWESRVKWNETTHRYNINGVMGPDEDHSNINNNAFTNVGAALNLHFGTYASCICNKLDPAKYPLNSNWTSIAKHVTLLYDRELDYHPQYDGYNLNITIKQADVTLLGYPLKCASVRASTRKNNLNLYGNRTRPSGPAMTWSIHAIGHLEVDSTPPSEELFNRTYIPYIHSPFYVWNEYIKGATGGASNFITGVGGFMQLIMFGYAGIRINADSMTIQNAQLPPNTDKLKLNGIFYAQMLFEFIVTRQKMHVRIRKRRDAVLVYIDDIEQNAVQNSFEFNQQQTFKLKPKGNSDMDQCNLPEDTVDELNIN